MTRTIISLLPTISTPDQMHYLYMKDDRVSLVIKTKDIPYYIPVKEIPENDTIFNYFK